MFNEPIFRDFRGWKSVRIPGTESRNMPAQWVRRLIILAYVVIGCVIAWNHGYLGLAWLRALASAILAILLWWLILLGVNLNIHP
jgi:hypothetical protein